MRIIIDGDAQPYKEEIVELARKYQVEVIIVTSVAHYSDNEKLKYAKVIIVDNFKQATDLRILNIVKNDDVVITCDTGLAYVLSGREIIVLSERGYVLNKDFLETKIFLVHKKKKILKIKKGKRKKIKGQKTFSEQDKKRLLINLENIIAKKGGVF